MVEEKDVAIIIPLYKSEISKLEMISLTRALTVFKNFKVIYICPIDLDIDKIDYIKTSELCVERFANYYFYDREGYNRLLLSCDFYKRFDSYEYILIYQLDAFVFFDKLLHFCNLKYDYIGSPWFHACGIMHMKGKRHHLKVGNGGFSLRRVRACYDLLLKNTKLLYEWNENEDMFFSYCGYFNINNFKVAPVEVARRFSFETSVRRLYRKNGCELPFGCHAWNRYGGDFYAYHFKKINEEYSFNNCLTFDEDDMYDKMIFQKRLTKKLLNHKNLMVFIPIRKQYSVVCFGKVGNILLKQLINANVKVSAIFDSEFERIRNVCDIPVYDIKKIYKCGLLIIATVKFEREIYSYLESVGMLYGTDFISLPREYARRFKVIGYEKILYELL